MTVITTSDEMRRAVGSWHAAGDTVCLVPTMGSIHAGHLALIDAARQAARRVVVSIYVNPTQFAAGEDFASYPRNFQADQQAIDAAGGVDAIYAPQGWSPYRRETGSGSTSPSRSAVTGTSARTSGPSP